MMAMPIVTLSASPRILQGLPHLVLVEALVSGYYYHPHFTDEET